MKIFKLLASGLLVAMLAACGGGGGNPGSASGGSGSGGSGSGSGTGTATSVPSLSITLVNSSGAEITNHALSQTSAQFLKVALKITNTTAAGVATIVPVAYGKVTLALDSPEAVLVPAVSAQLTDANGELLVRIAPASVSSQGAVTVKADATIDTTAVTGTYVVQATSGTVGLSGLVATPTTVQKGGSVNVSVNVTVNGSPAQSNTVSVAFNSTCGTAAPSPVLVDATGKATAVVQTTNSGACTVTASANGVATAPVAFTVSEPPLTALMFVSATPTLIYQTGSAGPTSSVVKFKIVDALGNAITTGKTVNASLTNTDGGINFCGSPTSATSGPDGIVSFSVCSGTLPATVQVKAVLADFPTVPATSSNILTIQTGLPTQRFFDLSASKLNFYAGGLFTDKFNGNTVDLSVFAADRLGNPVPDGTKVAFITEGGQINTTSQSSCLLATGRCTVQLIGQDYRPLGSSAANGDPRPGRVTVLAWADGEEYFIDKPDANGVYNNRYDAGELFEDLGNPYVDKDESGVFASAYTNLVLGTNEGETLLPLPTTPQNAAGTSACPTLDTRHPNYGLSAANTCNGVWDGYTKVRRSIVIVFSGGDVGPPPLGYDASIPTKYQTQTYSASKTAMSFLLSDYDGNPMPADATLSTTISPATSTCKVDGGFDGTYGSTTEPRKFAVTLTTCNSGDIVNFWVSVAVSGGIKKTGYAITVP